MGTTTTTPSTTYPRQRLLLDPTGPGAKAYDIRPAGGGMTIVAFVTGGVNGNSADDTAIRNLLDVSDYAAGPLELWGGGALPTYLNGATRIATAEAGIGRMVARS